MGWDTYAKRASVMGRYPTEFPHGAPSRFPWLPAWHGSVWAQVTAEDGTYGLGLTNYGDPVAAIINGHFDALLQGRDCFALEKLNDIMWRASKVYGSMGLTSAAQSAVDCALWDLVGKALGQPVYRLIGGPCRDRITCYATSDDLEWSQELGFRAFKVSCPAAFGDEAEGLDRIEQHIAQARERVGDHADLMFNPVMCFDAEYAVRVARRVRPYNLRWLEEPLIPEDLEGHIFLRQQINWVPLATGEHHHTRWPFRQLVEHRCVDVLQPDIKWVGGLSECIKIAHIAEAAGLKVILHGGANVAAGQHFSYAMPNVPSAEYWMGTPPGVPLEEAVLEPGVPKPKDGFVVPSSRPGLGYEIEEEWITPYCS